MKAGEEFAFRVGPFVAGGAGDVYRARGGKGDEHVLIHRQVVDSVVILREVIAEPVGETGVDAFHGFPELAPA